jgi:hypothetical protein
MPGFFEAWNRKSPPKGKTHTVMIQGQEKQVSLKQKLEILKNGEVNYMIKDNKIVVKPTPKAKSVYPILMTVQKGYHFLDGDIHWPNKMDDGGQAWLIEYE